MANRTFTAALAIVKVNGIAIGKMKDLNITENDQRVSVPKGLGSIFDDEFAVVKWSGQLQCSFWEINYTESGIPNAIRRLFGSNIQSQIAVGINTPNFEDQLVLDQEGVDLVLYKKITDLINPDGTIVPEAIVYASIRGCFIESDRVSVQDGNVSSRDQSFKYKYPIVFAAPVGG